MEGKGSLKLSPVTEQRAGRAATRERQAGPGLTHTAQNVQVEPGSLLVLQVQAPA